MTTLEALANEVWDASVISYWLPGNYHRVEMRRLGDRDVYAVYVLAYLSQRVFFGRSELWPRWLGNQALIKEADAAIMRAIQSCHFAIVHDRGGYC